MTYGEYCKNNFGYTPLTTTYEDYKIAERFGENAIRKTYDQLFKEFKNDYKLLTELCLTTGHMIWFHYNNGNCTGRGYMLATLYNELWETIDNYCIENLKGDELSYFLKTTD